MWQVRVSNLTGKVRDHILKKELGHLCRNFGPCSVYIIPNGDYKEAYVTFWTLDEAKAARRGLNNRILFERPMDVVPMKEPKIFGQSSDRASGQSDYGSRDDFGDRRRSEYDSDQRRYSQSQDEVVPTRTLFVGNLSLSVDFDEIRALFSRHGHVEEVDVKRPLRSATATYAFVKFRDVESARRAKSEMEGSVVGRHRIRLGYGKGSPSNRIRVEGLGSWASLDWLEREFDRFGAIKHVEYKAGGRYAIVEFDSLDAATAAAREMNRPDLSDKERKLSVSFEERMSPPPPSRHSSGRDEGRRDDREVERDSDGDRKVSTRRSGGEGRTGVAETSSQEDSLQRTQAGAKRTWSESEEAAPTADDGPDAKRPLPTNGEEEKEEEEEEEKEESLQEVGRRFAVAWRGCLALRNMAFPLRMHLVGGNPLVAEKFLRPVGASSPGGAVVPITQRLRLDPDKLEEVRRRVATCGPSGHCLLLAMPAPLPTQSSSGEGGEQNGEFQFRALRNLVTYLKQKQAAGVATLEKPVNGSSAPSSVPGETSETSGALHAFPPSDFAREQLLQVAPRLSETACNEDHLIVLLVCQ